MIGYGLWLYNRPTVDVDFRMDLTPYAQGWTRSIRHIGGYLTGDFTFTPETMPEPRIFDFYQVSIGCIVREITAGRVTWEGEIVEMTLTRGGVSFTTSLDPEIWHNNVIVDYGHDLVSVLALYPGIDETTTLER